MSNILKKAWITPGDASYQALSFESAEQLPEYRRLSVRESVFPAKPTPTNPQRHTIVIPLLSDDDLRQILRTIREYLHE